MFSLYYNEIKKGNSYNPDEVRITFKEGLNIRKIALVVEENTNEVVYKSTIDEITKMIFNYKLADEIIRNTYPIRTCNIDIDKAIKNKVRPCLNMHIKKCVGPCTGIVSYDAG